MHKRNDIYIVAVSGGVDSVVLLDILINQQDSIPIDQLPTPNPQLIVAHFDHGIRSDSASDAKFVEDLAAKYNLQFVTERANLGSQASENQARQARYNFLNRVKEQHNAIAVITAHHQDDVMETAIINLLRGTNRRGLSALKSTPSLIRPLLDIPKQVLLGYAGSHDLQWREDSTNNDIKYVRNYIRHNLLPKFSESGRRELLKIINTAGKLNQQIDHSLAELLPTQSSYQLKRYDLIMMPLAVSQEVIAHILLNLDSQIELNRKLVQNIMWFIKTAQIDKQFLLKGISIKVKTEGLIIVERS